MSHDSQAEENQLSGFSAPQQKHWITMLKRYHHMVGGTFRALDASIIAICWILAYWVRFYIPFFEVTKGLPQFDRYAALTPLIVLLWVFIFSYTQVYNTRTMLRRTDEIVLIVKSHTMALMLFLTLTYFFSEYRYSRGVMAFFGLLSGTVIVFVRLSLRNALRELRKRGIQSRNVLCIGEGPSLEVLLHKLSRFPELGARVVGVLVQPESLQPYVGKHRVIGHFEDVERIISRLKIDQVLIALPHAQHAHLDQILKYLRHQTVDIQIVPDIHEYAALGCAIEEFEGLAIVHINDSPLSGWKILGKRTGDLVLSGLALILLIPIFFIISLLIKLSSPGPIFYRQERMGLDGRIFDMLKFRSMSPNAEAQTGAVWARPHDTRRTWIGSILRKTSLDELPQFWNVLKGDMSLVGPRPERPVFVRQFREEIPYYMLRHKVKAGITGWAQVNGWRGNTSLDRRIECDLYYIRNWSYLFDLKILILTFWKGFIHKNAY